MVRGGGEGGLILIFSPIPARGQSYLVFFSPRLISFFCRLLCSSFSPFSSPPPHQLLYSRPTLFPLSPPCPPPLLLSFSHRRLTTPPLCAFEIISSFYDSYLMHPPLMQNNQQTPSPFLCFCFLRRFHLIPWLSCLLLSFSLCLLPLLP